MNSELKKLFLSTLLSQVFSQFDERKTSENSVMHRNVLIRLMMSPLNFTFIF